MDRGLVEIDVKSEMYSTRFVLGVSAVPGFYRATRARRKGNPERDSETETAITVSACLAGWGSGLHIAPIRHLGGLWAPGNGELWSPSR